MSNDNIKIDLKKSSSDMQAKHGSLTAWMPIINLPKKKNHGSRLTLLLTAAIIVPMGSMLID